MDHPLRVLLIGRHFWPLGSIDGGAHLTELAKGLHAAGLHVSVATAKQSTSSTERFQYREFLVHRPVRIFSESWAARGDRSPAGYIRKWQRWIEDNVTSCDVIVCDSARHEAVAAVQAAATLNVPIIVRLAGDGSCSDLRFFEHDRVGKRCRAAASLADAVVVANASSHRGWIASGGSDDRVHRIPVGVPSRTTQVCESGDEATQPLRSPLSKINGDLFVPDACSVVLSVEPMRRGSGLMTLVESAYSLSQNIPHLQYWLLGDGPTRDAVYTRLKSDGLRQAIAMPGSFALIEDVLQSADLLVHSGDSGFQHHLPMAIASGLPIVISTTATSTEFFGHSVEQAKQSWLNSQTSAKQPPSVDSEQAGELVWWFDPNRTKTLRLAVQQITCHPKLARQRAERLHRLMLRQQSQGETIASYVNLIRDAVAKRLR